MAETGLQTVVLMADAGDRVPAVAAALAAVRGVPVIDTTREAKFCWGLLAERRPAGECAALVAALAERQVAARAVRAEAIPDLAGIQTPDKIDMAADGFRCRLHRGSTPLIPWAAVNLVAAAVVTSTTLSVTTQKEGPTATSKLLKTGITLATGIPIPSGRSKNVEVRKEERSVGAYLDIGLTWPAGRFRLNADRLDFSYLGERRGYDSFGNFKLVALDAANHVTENRTNRGVAVLKAGKPVSAMGYETLQDLEREERWLLARLALV